MLKRTIIASSLLLALLLSSPVTAQWEGLSLTLLSTPCRIVDTRVTSAPLASNEIRIFSVDPGFSSLQGGATNCGVPADAAAVKLNVKGQSIVLDGGNFRVFNADGSALGVYSQVNLQDPGQFVAAEMSVPISSSLLVAIHTYAQAHAVVDVIGYYKTMDITAVWGEVVTINVASPAVGGDVYELTLDSGVKAVCDEKYINTAQCASLVVGDRIAGSGHVLNFFGSVNVYLHTGLTINP